MQGHVAVGMSCSCAHAPTSRPSSAAASISRELVRRAGEDGRAERGERGGVRAVVERGAVVGEREQDDHAHAGADERRGPAQHRLGIAALVEVGDEDENGLGGVADERLAVGERLVDVRAAAELDAEQQLDRVVQLLGEVDDARVEGDHLRVERGDRGERGAEHAGRGRRSRPCSRSGRARG